MLEYFFALLPLFLFLVLLYVVWLAGRFVRAWERIAESMERSGFGRPTPKTVYDTNRD